jgi:peptide/nickel transport system permease protein
MNKNKDFYIRLSLLADLLLITLMILNGTNWFLSIVVVETIMWLIRCYWLSKVLLLFIGKRLLHMIPIVLSVVAIGFFLIQLAPGDIFTQMTLNPNLKPETVDRYRAAFGLDKEWYIQFFRYIWNALHLDFGFSINYRTPVFDLVSQRAGNTLTLAIATIVLAWGLSIPAGIYSATHQYKMGDQVITVFAFIGLALPSFFAAFLLIFVVSSTGSWLPIGGMWSVDVNQMNVFQKAIDLARHMAIPVFVLATRNMASLTRIMRANMLEIMSQQYITTARAKGLAEKTVVYKHALRNAINPMITIFGYQFGYILGGSALVEAVTAWPGLGSLMLQGIMSQDLYLVEGSLVYGVALLVVGNLIADILLGIVDPRVRIS